jgi:hypothetical protein
MDQADGTGCIQVFKKSGVDGQVHQAIAVMEQKTIGQPAGYGKYFPVMVGIANAI